jgi:hypothetical protein
MIELQKKIKQSMPERELAAQLLNQMLEFKKDYYSDFNTFRQMDGAELTGGLGLIYVEKTFDNVEFRNIFKEGVIRGTKVILEKKIENSIG